jgi:hypothetical protein
MSPRWAVEEYSWLCAQVQAKLAKLPQSQLAFMPPDVLKTIQVCMRPHTQKHAKNVMVVIDKYSHPQ